MLKSVQQSPNAGWANKYIIVFVNRATSDEWWRAVTDSVAAGHTWFGGVKRISPQFYTHNPGVAGNYDIVETLRDERCAAKFLGRMFFTRLNRIKNDLPLSIAPVANYVDHISGHG